MIKEIKTLLKQLLPFTFLLVVTHYFIQIELFKTTQFYYSVQAIYIFHFLVTGSILSTLIVVKNNFFKKTGFAFMAFSILKMLASVLFLVPVIRSAKIDYMPDVISFFVPYFLFLLFEIVFSMKLLGSKPEE